jgi:hypothetical protein
LVLEIDRLSGLPGHRAQAGGSEKIQRQYLSKTT